MPIKEEVYLTTAELLMATSLWKIILFIWFPVLLFIVIGLLYKTFKKY